MRFLLLGEEPLLVRCAESLLQRHHVIEGIVSRGSERGAGHVNRGR